MEYLWTPGPWQWQVNEDHQREEPLGEFERSYLRGNTRLNSTVLFAPYPDSNRKYSYVYVRPADALLIEKSPELFEALRQMADIYDALSPRIGMGAREQAQRVMWEAQGVKNG